ncbi:topoisomerase DNA-binding C4 zinc finger domain-containing protein [Methanocaldococcus indicus]|uniref:topoisomerase DNA-binding C4 zinc finger domain-containing protein n=1 Tax=Methanocaldococcus indicus TaxID=213231 RepID=UPI003C6CC93F
MDELFNLLSKDIHFNVTKLNNENYNQNWKVPEGFISIIGLENAKKPVFYYGLTDSYKEKTGFKKIKSVKGEKLLFFRVYYVFDRKDLLDKEKYVVANAFNGLLLAIKIDKDDFINKAIDTLTKAYEEDEFVRESIEYIKESHMFDNIEEAIKFMANRDYNWLIGRIKYYAKTFQYSGEGYYLLPLKTNLEITEGLIVDNDKVIVDLENCQLFQHYILYIDTKNNKIIYNRERLCTKIPKILNIKVKEDECPWCGAKLRVVKTKKGEFLGCSNYPKCLYRRFPKKS